MAKLFKFEKVLKTMVDYYDDGYLRLYDYPELKLILDLEFYHNKTGVYVKTYECLFNKTIHYGIEIFINGREYYFVSFTKKPIDIVVDFLYSCLEYNQNKNEVQK